MNSHKSNPKLPNQKLPKPKTPPTESVFTKEDFLKALRKVTKPVSPKPSPAPKGSKTSG